VVVNLSSGEFSLLRFLGEAPGQWFSSAELARQVFLRSDASGRQLVWKYVSTLKRKAFHGGECLIRASRKWGYCCARRVVVAA